MQVQGLAELPAFSPVAQRVLAVVGDEDITVADFAHIIEQDPAMLARIIGVANSAYFGQRETITSAEKAIFNALGLRLAKNLAIAIALTGPFDTSRCTGFRPELYWQDAMLSAHLAQALSRKVTPALQPVSDDAYLSGLLHSFGLLPLVYLFPEQMVIVFGTTPPGDTLAAAEQDTLGTDHHEAGGWLARKWHLPERISTAIEHSHEPDYRGADWPLVQVTGYTARWAARELAAQRAVPGDAEHPATQYATALEALGLDVATRESVEQDIRQRRDDILSLARIFALG